MGKVPVKNKQNKIPTQGQPKQNKIQTQGQKTKPKTLYQRTRQKILRLSVGTKQSLMSLKRNFVKGKETHLQMTEIIKIVLILGIVVTGSIYHYTGFMNKHPKLFVYELILYLCGAFLAFLQKLRRRGTSHVNR